MELCHKKSDFAKSRLEKLGQFVLEWRTRWETSTPDFERFEHELHARIMAIRARIVDRRTGSL